MKFNLHLVIFFFISATMEYSNLSNVKNGQICHCLFNNAHVMPAKTLALHLTKCPDRPKNAKNCPFNNLHVVDRSELEEHQQHCPDRYQLDSMLYESSNFSRPITNIVNRPTFNINADNDDSWDDILPETNSVLENIKKSSCALKPISGLTKSERKKYRSEINLKYRTNESSCNTHEQKASQNNGGKQLYFGKKPNTNN